ncbi:DUF4249 domain-containing protein [Salibacteraceae bacterium]|jgi:hypothetical protein|nr:DUF4249 domain-containing protein [Salibacteraceae bacterium]
MKTAVYLILSALLLTSCTEVIDFDLNDSQTRIVIEGEITNEQKAHEIRVTESTSYYYSEEPPAVSGATVTISDGANTFVLTEVDTLPGVYRTEPTVEGKLGERYTLNVTYDNQTYTAVDTMRGVVDMESVFVVPVEDTLFTTDTFYWIIMFGQENPGLGDHYVWDYYLNGVLQTEPLVEKAFGRDDFVDGASPSEGWPVFNNIPYDAFEVGDSISLEIRSVSGEYFDFIIESLLNTAFRGGFFDGPPANVSSNIDNGAIGFFRASAVSRKKTRVFF